MSLQLYNILSTLLFLVCLHTVSPEILFFPVIQTPPSLNVVEGTTLKMECKIRLSQKWFIGWYVNKTGGKKMTLNNTSSISIDTNTEERWSHLTLKRADVADSGIYVCDVGYYSNVSGISHLPNNGTRVTVNEITDLMVNQTPGYIEKKEGEIVAIECSFRTVSNYSTMYVKWHKDGQNITDERDSLSVIEDPENGFASLTLKNTKVGDSGSYVCEVGSRSRNLLGTGTPSHVVITAGREKKQSVLNNGGGHTAGTGAAAGVGTGVGVILLALLIGVFVWRRKQSSNATPLATSEPEGVSTKKVQTQHPPLASQASDVTYADLQFNKRDVKPDAEVVYAEVKVGRKQKRSLHQAKPRVSNH